MTPAPRVRAATAADLLAIGRMGARAELPTGDDDEWLLVAEAADGAPAACVRVRRAIGLGVPRHWYHVGCVVHAAAELKLFHRQRTLLLGNDHTGASELADLACDSAALGLAERSAALQRVVQAALLLIARERGRFAPQLIVELPGLRDAGGQSPFWRGLGAHFYAGDPQQAAARFGDTWRTHVAALLPRHPLVVSFLVPDAQAALGQVAPDARSRMEILALEGLHYGHHVSIHDGGPVFEGHLDTLPGMLNAGRRRIGAAAAGEALQPWLVARDGVMEVCSVPAAGDRQSLRLAPERLAALGLSPGEAVWARRLVT